MTTSSFPTTPDGLGPAYTTATAALGGNNTLSVDFHPLLHQRAADSIDALESGLISGMALRDKGGHHFDVKSYGAVGDGTTSDGAALRATFDACLAAGGGIVFLPPGVYNCNDLAGAIFSLPSDNSRVQGRVSIRGAGRDATKVKLSSATPRFMDFNRVANYDVFRNVTIEDLTIDANSIGGKHHVILGTYQNNAFQTAINIEDIAVRRVRTINVVSNGLGTHARWNVALCPKVAALNDATRITTKNIVFSDVMMEGGDMGIMVAATIPGASADGCNALIQNVTIERCWHSTLSAPSTFRTQGNFQLGSYGMVDSVTLRDCYGYGAGDCTYEMDNVSNGLVENCVAEDYWNSAFLGGSLTTPLNGIHAAKMIWQSCTSMIKGRSTAGGLSTAYQIGEYNSIGFGTIEIKGARHYATLAPTVSGGGFFHATTSTDVEHLIFDTCLEILNFGTYAGTAQNYSTLYLDTINTVVEVKGLKTFFMGAYTGGGSALNYFGLRLGGQGCWYSIEDYQPTTALTLNGVGVSVICIDIGNTSAPPHLIGGVITRLKPLSITGTSGSLRGVKIGAIANWTPTPGFTLRDCDFSSAPAAGWIDVIYETGTENSGKVQFPPGNVWKSGIAPASGGYVATFSKAGVISDADFTVVPPIGTIGIDTTNLRIYVKTAAATWKSVVVA